MQKIWNSEQFAEVIVEHSYTDVDTFLAAIGEHHVSARSVAQRIVAPVPHAAICPSSCRRRCSSRVATTTTAAATRRRPRRGARRRHGPARQLLHAGARRRDHRLRHPRSRGVSVHRHDCANAMSLAQDQAARMIEVEWDGDRREELVHRRRRGRRARPFTAAARRRERASASRASTSPSCETIVGDDRVAKMRFEFEMSSAAQLGSVLNTIKRIDAVYDVHRIVPGGSDRQLNRGLGRRSRTASLARRADVPDQPRDA